MGVFYEEILWINFLSIAVSSSRRAISARVVWHPVVFPKRFVITGKVKALQGESFLSVLIRFDFHVSHLA